MQARDSGVSCQEVHQREPIVYWAPPSPYSLPYPTGMGLSKCFYK